MYRLTPVIRNYAWGSHESLARLTGRPVPTAEPEAELWMGAHEEAPARLTVDGRELTLDQFIASDPRGVLGADVAERFDGRLPFLLKVLAPEKALSIQVHPDTERACSAPPGTYVDRWPKPESICAVTEFEAFAGLRTIEDVCQIVDELDLPILASLVDGARNAAEPLRELLSSILHGPPSATKKLVSEVVAACNARREIPAYDAIARVSDQFPGDVGLAVLMLMEHRVLEPGDYAFIGAGVLHAYVRGVAVELLANSDNVVRAGLTAKPVNVEELLHVVDPTAELILECANVDGPLCVYPSDAPHFRLRRICGEGQPVDLKISGPQIILSLNGSTIVMLGSGSLVLEPGQSCFVGAAETSRVSTAGVAYIASVD